MALVSVVIPAFNRRNYVLQAIESVMAQTFADFQVVVVDDGSCDGTAGAVAERYPGAACIIQENRGVSAARNKGINSTSSPYVAFLDSDDLWLPRKLEIQMAHLLETGSRVCHADESWVRRGILVKKPADSGPVSGVIVDACAAGCCISPSSVVIARSVFQTVGMFDESMRVCEDYELWLRLSLRYRVCAVKQPLIIKRGGHEDQLSRRYTALDRYRVKALYKHLKDIHAGKRMPAPEREFMESVNRAVSVFYEKIGIVIAGCRKRERFDEEKTYASMYDTIKGLYGTTDQ